MRNLLFIGLFAAVCLVLVAVLHLLDLRVPKIVPEWPAQAETIRQNPSENAYETLMEAERLLPKVKPGPKLLPHPDIKDRQIPYHAGPGTIGRALGIQRPDDDPELLTYLESCQTAFEKVHEALDKPHYLPPPAPNPYMVVSDFAAHKHLAFYAQALTRQPGQCEKALPYLVDAVRLASLLTVHSAFRPLTGGDSTLDALAHCAWRAPSDEFLRKAAGHLSELPPPCDDRREMLLIAWAHIDQMMDEMHGESRNMWEGLGHIFMNFHLARIARAHIARKDAYLELVEQPYTAVVEKRGELPMFRGPFQWLGPEPLIRQLVAKAQARQWPYWRAVFAVALERYKRAHGEYPGQLEALVPEYVGAIPPDMLTGAPLRYKRHAEAYILYSLGEDGVDQVAEAELKGKPQRPLGDDVLLITPWMMREASGTASGANDAEADRRGLARRLHAR